jgi:hypothetical protein
MCKRQTCERLLDGQRCDRMFSSASCRFACIVSGAAGGVKNDRIARALVLVQPGGATSQSVPEAVTECPTEPAAAA